MTRILVFALLTTALAGGGFYLSRLVNKPDIDAAYAMPLTPPAAPMRVFHLGHSLVGRDMPAMLAQLAGNGHSYHSQLGWGTSLREHWDPKLPINGFETENAHDHYRDAKEALASGSYDAVVLTEMVEIKDAIKYHKSGKFLRKWAGEARAANPDTRVYLYETWHHLNDPAGWLDRLDADYGAHWQQQVLFDDLRNRPDSPARIIPAGQVMARFARDLTARGGVEGLASIEGLFARNDDGTLDTIHVNDLGAYLVALTHYAVLYHRSPVGLPYALQRADGTAAQAPSAEAARLMQEVVWDVVQSDRLTGVGS